MPGSLILWSLKCFWANTSYCAVFYLVASSSLLPLYIKTAKTNETAQMRSSSLLYGKRAIFACWKSYHHVAKGWHFINIFTVLNLSPSDQTFFEKNIIICYVQLLPPARQRKPWQKKQCIKLRKWRHIMRLTVCRQLKKHTFCFVVCLWSIFVKEQHTGIWRKKRFYIGTKWLSALVWLLSLTRGISGQLISASDWSDSDDCLQCFFDILTSVFDIIICRTFQRCCW